MSRPDLRSPARGFRAYLAAALLALAPLLTVALPAPLPLPVPVEEQSQAPAVAGRDALREQRRLLERCGADAWHVAGHRGRGVRIAVLDSGFRGYRAHLGKALPADVIVRSFRLDGNLESRDSQHGILCAEVIHALAPDAELLLANWEPGRPDTFLDAFRWAKAQGAKLVTCSCIMPSWSDGDGGGAIHAALAGVLGAGERPGDLLCVASAGNTAQRHWQGPFRAGPDGFHEWQPGKTDNELTPWGTAAVSVQLYCPGSAAYEVCIHDRATGAEVVRAASAAGKDRCTASAGFVPEKGKSYFVRVRHVAGPAGRFHLVALHSALQFARPEGSICFPADGKDVVAVGAVTAKGERCRYSACGPTSPRPKPDLVAAVPFPSVWRAKPFGGTSAAAPQAAALAALCWSKYPDWTAARVRSALHAAALDLGPPGHDSETGYGLIRLPAPASPVGARPAGDRGRLAVQAP